MVLAEQGLGQTLRLEAFPMTEPQSNNQAGGCGFLLALLALFVAFGALNQARSKANRNQQSLRRAASEIDSLKRTVDRLEVRIEALESP